MAHLTWGRMGKRLIRGLSVSVAMSLVAVVGTTAANARPPATGVPLSAARATEAFGLDLLGAGSGNRVISPDSIATALAMAGTGAKGETAAQIAAGLHSSPGRLGSFGGLQHTLASEAASAAAGDPEPPQLTIANGLFVQEGFPLVPAFTTGLQDHFGAAPEAVDFIGDLPGAIATINAWTSQHTEGVIPALFSELPAETRLVLANAVYLKAKWQARFKKGDTYRQRFHADAGSTEVEFMHQTTRLPYGGGAECECQAVELPYEGSTLSLLVVLPSAKSSVAALGRRLSRSGLGGVVRGLKPRTVELSLPRFHLHTETELVPPLERLGMKAPFGEAADFSGISEAAALKIAAVKHIADLKVDEEGTVAAAVTGVTVTVKSAPGIPPDAVTFDADRPFLFFIRDDQTGAVLFAGRLADPSAALSD